MQKNSLFRDLALLILLVLSGMFVGTLLASVLIRPFIGIDVLSNLDLLDVNSSSIESSRVFKFYQFFQVIFSFILPAQLFSRIRSGQSSLNYLGLIPVNKMHLFLGFLLVLFSSPLVAFLSELNTSIRFPESMQSIESSFKLMEEQAQKTTMIFLKYENVLDLFLNFFIISLLAALSEELLFRGVLQKILVDGTQRLHIGILLTAFIFSAFHLQFYGLIPRFFLGVLLGYAYYFSGSLWVPIVMHFVNNFIAVLIFVLYKEGLTTIDPMKNEYFGIIGLSISIIFTLAIVWYWLNYIKKNGVRLG